MKTVLGFFLETFTRVEWDIDADELTPFYNELVGVYKELNLSNRKKLVRGLLYRLMIEGYAPRNVNEKVFYRTQLYFVDFGAAYESRPDVWPDGELYFKVQGPWRKARQGAHGQLELRAAVTRITEGDFRHFKDDIASASVEAITKILLPLDMMRSLVKVLDVSENRPFTGTIDWGGVRFTFKEMRR